MILMIVKVLNTYRMSNSPTSDSEPRKNKWLTKGSESEVLPEGQRSQLGHPFTKEPFKSFIETKGQTRLTPKPEQEHQTSKEKA